MNRRYAELRPVQLENLWSEKPLAVVPWGALEWHGPHLPLGLDGLVAEAFAERLSERVGGVVLPCMYVPITTLPHPYSLQYSTETVRSIFDETIDGLAGAGATTIALVTGHYAHGHHVELYDAAVRAMKRHTDLRVFAGTPLEPIGESQLLDHAARFETSQLLALRPELVDTSALPTVLTPKSSAVLGEDPRLGSEDEGHRLLEKGLDAWTKWLDDANPKSLLEHYVTVRSTYEGYANAHYKDSWEDAIVSWWETK